MNNMKERVELTACLSMGPNHSKLCLINRMRRSSTGLPCRLRRRLHGRPWLTMMATAGAIAWRIIPVGTGPFRLTVYDKQYRFVLSANADWYGLKTDAPGSIFPSQGEAHDIASGVIDAASVGKQLPFLQRVEFRRERESIPRFNKFLQGYYDAGDIVKESFDTVVQNDRLSPEMTQLGMKLEKAAEPTVYYIGFNMDDPVVGRAGGDRKPETAAGHEPGDRCPAISETVHQWPRRAGPVGFAARPVRS